MYKDDITDADSFHADFVVKSFVLDEDIVVLMETILSSTVRLIHKHMRFLYQYNQIFLARRVPFELGVHFSPSGGFPQSQYNKGIKLNFFQVPC